jgi:hypothetical protein
MTQSPTTVAPGDLITAAAWNQLTAQIAALQAQAGATGPGVPVPNVFGNNLSNVQAIFAVPTMQLLLGSILDTLGNAINPQATGAGVAIVLSQSPPAGSMAAAGTSVNLLVSALPGAAPIVAPVPAITSFSPNPAAVTTELVISGQNFATLFSDNSVAFGTIQASPTNASLGGKLHVVVPTGIPGVATSPGGATVNIPIVVTTSAGASPAMTCGIAAPPATPPPSITIPTPVPVLTLGQSATLNGTGFGGIAQANTVTFDGIPAVVNSASSTQLVVTVPTTISGLAGPAPQIRTGVPVVVTVGGVASATAIFTVAKLS